MHRQDCENKIEQKYKEAKVGLVGFELSNLGDQLGFELSNLDDQLGFEISFVEFERSNVAFELGSDRSSVFELGFDRSIVQFELSNLAG